MHITHLLDRDKPQSTLLEITDDSFKFMGIRYSFHRPPSGTDVEKTTTSVGTNESTKSWPAYTIN